jgi:hypothetical protein
MLTPAMLGIIRHLLTILAGWLVAAGWIEASEAETVIGAVLALIGVGWLVLEKRRRA